eukprot:scaffold4599_cov116-Isochrysis_galbana.AAC.1
MGEEEGRSSSRVPQPSMTRIREMKGEGGSTVEEGPETWRGEGRGRGCGCFFGRALVSCAGAPCSISGADGQCLLSAWARLFLLLRARFVFLLRRPSARSPRNSGTGGTAFYFGRGRQCYLWAHLCAIHKEEGNGRHRVPFWAGAAVLSLGAPLRDPQGTLERVSRIDAHYRPRRTGVQGRGGRRRTYV